MKSKKNNENKVNKSVSEFKKLCKYIRIYKMKLRNIK